MPQWAGILRLLAEGGEFAPTAIKPLDDYFINDCKDLRLEKKRVHHEQAGKRKVPTAEDTVFLLLESSTKYLSPEWRGSMKISHITLVFQNLMILQKMDDHLIQTMAGSQ